jgi:hypothetical protein
VDRAFGAGVVVGLKILRFKTRNSMTAPAPLRINDLEPNIEGIDVQPGLVVVAWRCPAAGRVVASSQAAMNPDQSTGGRVRAAVKRSAINEVASAITRVTGALGGPLGRVLNTAAATLASETNAKLASAAAYPKHVRDDAVMRAFARVRHEFEWSAQRKCFVARLKPGLPGESAGKSNT